MGNMLKKLEEELERYKEDLERFNCRLSQELSVLEDVKSEVNILKCKRKEILENIKITKEAIKKAEKRIECPKCNREFTLSYLKKALKEDENGLFWECQNKLCDFKGYKNKKGFTIEFDELIRRKKIRERKFIEKNFHKLEIWILESPTKA